MNARGVYGENLCRILQTANLDAWAGMPYSYKRSRLVTGVAPGLQNQWQAERSAVGSTPMRLRHSTSNIAPISPIKTCGALLLSSLLLPTRSH